MALRALKSAHVVRDVRDLHLLRVVSTVLDPSFHYKTLACTTSTTSYDAVCMLVKKYSIRMEDQSPQNFFLAETYEDDQGCHSRALVDNEVLSEVQARWTKQRPCTLVLCRNPTKVVPCATGSEQEAICSRDMNKVEQYSIRVDKSSDSSKYDVSYVPPARVGRATCKPPESLSPPVGNNSSSSSSGGPVSETVPAPPTREPRSAALQDILLQVRESIRGGLSRVMNKVVSEATPRYFGGWSKEPDTFVIQPTVVMAPIMEFPTCMNVDVAPLGAAAFSKGSTHDVDYSRWWGGQNVIFRGAEATGFETADPGIREREGHYGLRAEEGEREALKEDALRSDNEVEHIFVRKAGPLAEKTSDVEDIFLGKAGPPTEEKMTKPQVLDTTSDKFASILSNCTPQEVPGNMSIAYIEGCPLHNPQGALPIEATFQENLDSSTYVTATDHTPTYNPIDSVLTAKDTPQDVSTRENYTTADSPINSVLMANNSSTPTPHDMSAHSPQHGATDQHVLSYPSPDNSVTPDDPIQSALTPKGDSTPDDSVQSAHEGSPSKQTLPQSLVEGNLISLRRRTDILKRAMTQLALRRSLTLDATTSNATPTTTGTATSSTPPLLLFPALSSPSLPCPTSSSVTTWTAPLVSTSFPPPLSHTTPTSSTFSGSVQVLGNLAQIPLARAWAKQKLQHHHLGSTFGQIDGESAHNQSHDEEEGGVHDQSHGNGLPTSPKKTTDASCIPSSNVAHLVTLFSPSSDGNSVISTCPPPSQTLSISVRSRASSLSSFNSIPNHAFSHLTRHPNSHNTTAPSRTVFFKNLLPTT